MIVWARLQDDNNKIRGFIVERNFKGVSTPKIQGKVENFILQELIDLLELTLIF